MKVEIYDIKGDVKGKVELPKIFESKIREDIVAKFFEVSKFIQPYSSKERAGMESSASGKISHRRHKWKGHYGKGISRIPRKTMWRRGTQFYWIGATMPGSRGGRRAHPPKGIGKEKKINLKEVKIAMESAISSTMNKERIIERYSSIQDLKISLPVILRLEDDKIKTKMIIEFLRKIFQGMESVIFKEKKKRAGKGKVRGRKYKSNAGLLFVKDEGEKIKMKGIEVKNVGELEIRDLYPLGRLVVYTEKAIERFGCGKK